MRSEIKASIGMEIVFDCGESLPPAMDSSWVARLRAVAAALRSLAASAGGPVALRSRRSDLLIAASTASRAMSCMVESSSAASRFKLRCSSGESRIPYFFM